MKRLARLTLIAIALSASVVLAAALAPRISSIIIPPEGDYTLTVSNPSGIGTAVLTTGVAQRLHLTTDADADSHRITGARAGVEDGDSVEYGQNVSSLDFDGTFPGPTLRNPILNATLTVPIITQAQGTCWTGNVSVPGAFIGYTALVTASQVSYPAGFAYAARVRAADSVEVRVCAIVAASTPSERTMLVSVVP